MAGAHEAKATLQCRQSCDSECSRHSCPGLLPLNSDGSQAEGTALSDEACPFGDIRTQRKGKSHGVGPGGPRATHTLIFSTMSTPHTY